ncbi:MAG: serine hydrolase [Candidatus Babeliales bacterium]
MIFIKSKLDKYIKAYVELGWFSGSVLVAKDGKILLCKAYGMANYEHNIPNTPQTKFRIGSLTKQFTAMAIMLLREKKLLHVNDKICKYIPDYPNGDKITIHHLLTHTSGIPNFTEFPECKIEQLKSHNTEQLINIFKDKSLEFEPGEKYNYSNSGYILLTYIIEKISEKNYETFLKENIFEPLGMKDSGCDSFITIIKNRASGYGIFNDELVNAAYIDMSFTSGAGILYSTIEDLYLWDQALYKEKLVSQKSLDEIFTPFKDSYGYGWIITQSSGHKLVAHAGGINGFSSDISRYPDDHVCIIVLSNFEHAQSSEIAAGLEAIIFGEKYEIPKKLIVISINPEVYNQYVGDYKLKENFFLTITKENNKLFVQATGQSKFQIYPESETKFFYKYINAQISFVRDEDNKVTKLILHQGGMDQEADKVE